MKETGFFGEYQSTKIQILRIQDTAPRLTKERESPMKNKLHLKGAQLRNRIEITGFPVNAENSLRKKACFISHGICKLV